MTRTVGAAIGFLLIMLFFAGVAIEKTRAESPRAVQSSVR
jgi:Na+-translocating ferredoxin:NAD+ oxidoreductase RnfA subunit